MPQHEGEGSVEVEKGARCCFGIALVPKTRTYPYFVRGHKHGDIFAAAARADLCFSQTGLSGRKCTLVLKHREKKLWGKREGRAAVSVLPYGFGETTRFGA